MYHFDAISLLHYCRSAQVLADLAYDTNAIRKQIEQQSAVPNIPPRRTRSQLDRVMVRIGSDESLELLVNNAGISLAGMLIDTDAATIDKLLAVNVVVPTLLAGAAVRAFAARGHGGVINLSSVLALAPEMFDGTYSGTKAFILNLSQGLAK